MQNHSDQHRHTNRTNTGMRKRTLVLAAFFIIFGFGLLVYQLYVLQLRDDEIYRTEAVSQQLKDTVLPATRGSIYSSTGKLLAKSNTVWNIVADPSESEDYDISYIRQACEEIAAIINSESVTADSLFEQMTARNAKGELYQYRVLARGVDMPTADAVMEYAKNFRYREPGADEDDKGKRILSLSKEQSAVRSYPYGAFMSSVLGFCNNEGDGMYGLEKSYNEVLAGTPGRSITSRNLYGDELANGEAEEYPAIDGNHLWLTINDYIQSVAEEYLYKAIEDFDVMNRGCAIVMNVKTGAVLAMASTEQFDPNQPYDIYDETLRTILEGGLLDAATVDTLESRLGEKEVKDIVVDGLISEEEYSTVQGMMREAQWKNKNITELYYPGSVFKLVTASAALDSGVMDENQEFYCGPEGYTVNADSQLYRHTYGCALGYTHGVQNLSMALNNSCNVYFIQVAQKMTPKIFFDYIKAFGFTEPTGVDLPHETRWMLYHDQQAMEEINTNLFSQAFGQNLAITPLQMATAVAAVTNGGYLVTPYVVDHITDTSGTIVEEHTTEIRRQVISEEVSATLREMMQNNVGHGEAGHSCRNAYVAGYSIGGKSGTAEQLNRSDRWDGDYHKAMSFAAVLPINDPEIEVFVMLDDPRLGNDLAGDVVAPVVGNIISEIAPYLGIEQDPDYNPEGEVLVPNCVNNSWNSAQVSLNVNGLGHKLIGQTGTIVYQYPYAGTYAPAGSTIYLYTTSDQNQTTTVPDVIDKTGTFAAQMLKAAGLNVKIEGDASARVTAQSEEAGSTAGLGTIVTVTTQ